MALSRFKNENVACKATRFKTHGYTMVFGIGGRQYGKIKKIQKALEGSMKNPNLTEIDKRMLMEGLKKVNSYIMRIEDLFAPYGGIE